MSNNVAVIIPARSGSKGLPGKNLIDLGGLPLIAYSISHGLYISESDTYVLTDGLDIATVARKYGAKVPYLRDPLGDARDEATTEEVIDNFLMFCDSFNIFYKYLVLLQPTSPLRSLETIKKIIELLKDGLDSGLTLSLLDRFLWESSANQLIPRSYNLSMRPRRQDIINFPYLIETGSAYLFDVEMYKKNKIRLFGDVKKILVPSDEAFEIDDFVDLELIRVYVERLHDKFGIHNFAKC